MNMSNPEFPATAKEPNRYPLEKSGTACKT
jgi:hypothetical protein